MTMLVFTVSGVIHISISMRVYQIMKTNHDFEFQRTKKSMRLQFIVVFLYYFLGALLYFYTVANIIIYAEENQ